MSELTHKLESLLEPRASHCLRIKIHTSDVFVIRDIYALDKSIYGLDGGWSGTIVSTSGLSFCKKNLFKDGSGVDFYESDVSEIFDETTDELIYRR
ncbi:MAG: hypothetical protein ACFUZC_09900 [Chthoniobacteraceae bacterium]